MILSIILYILTNLPSLIGLIEQIIAFIHGIPHSQRAAVLEQLQQVVHSGDAKAVQAFISKKPSDSVVSVGADLKI